MLLDLLDKIPLGICVLSREDNYSTRRLVEEGEKRGHTVEVIDTTPLGNPVLDEVLTEMAAAKKSRTGAAWVGKLGGRELNFSSDIDLVFLFDAFGGHLDIQALRHGDRGPGCLRMPLPAPRDRRRSPARLPRYQSPAPRCPTCRPRGPRGHTETRARALQ